MTERIKWHESKGVQKQEKFNKKESIHIKQILKVTLPPEGKITTLLAISTQ